MTADLVLSRGVILVDLREVSYCPTTRIQRQFGLPQILVNGDHIGYICPLRIRIIERVGEAWANRVLIRSISVPRLISPSSAYYAWLKIDMRTSEEVEAGHKKEGGRTSSWRQKEAKNFICFY